MASTLSLGPAAAHPTASARSFGTRNAPGPQRVSFAGAVAREAPELRAQRPGAAQGSRRSRNTQGRAPVHVCADMRATGEPEGAYSPSAPFYKVEAVLRPWRIKFVCRALIEQGIRGVTVADVRGFGAQGGSRERQAGSEFSDDSLVLKAKLEVVIIADQVEDVIETIIREARTGEIGDGKIFISPIAEVIRVRTGERGVEAERMAGGRQELLKKDHIYTTVDGGEML